MQAARDESLGDRRKSGSYGGMVGGPALLVVAGKSIEISYESTACKGEVNNTW